MFCDKMMIRNVRKQNGEVNHGRTKSEEKIIMSAADPA